MAPIPVRISSSGLAVTTIALVTQAKWLTRRTTTNGTSGRTSGTISAGSATTTATAARYASINGGSATSWIAINASRTVATTTDVSIAVTAGVGAGDGGAVTVGSSIGDFLVPEWNHGESAGLSE